MSRLARFVQLFPVAFALSQGDLPAQTPVPVSQKAPPIEGRGVVTAPTLVDPTTGVPVADAGPRLDFSFRSIPLEEAIKVVQAAYHQESKGYLNVMIPEHLRDVAQTNILTLEVKQVTVGELFNLLGRASQRAVPYWPGLNTMNYQMGTTGYTLSLVSANGGNLTYLLGATFPPQIPPRPETQSNAEAPPPSEPPKAIQFYQLESYLERFTVEDITTAIKTGWELAGYKELPTMKYHGETKLLIVAGKPEQIAVLEQVLRVLPGARPGSRPVPGPVQPSLPPLPARP